MCALEVVNAIEYLFVWRLVHISNESDIDCLFIYLMCLQDKLINIVLAAVTAVFVVVRLACILLACILHVTFIILYISVLYQQ